MLMGASASAENAAAPAALNPGVTERVETRLVQFEVRVSRKGDPVGGLTATDFDIELGGKSLKAFTVDDMCAASPAPPSGTMSARPGSFIFYFDEQELTVEGRLRAIEVARLVAPALLTRGHDVLILRNGNALRADTTWTHDAAEVTAALDRFAADSGNGDSARAGVEEQRAELLLGRLEAIVHESDMRVSAEMRKATNDRYDIIAMLAQRETAITAFMGEFETLAKDEVRRVGRDVGRLRTAVRSLALRESPKGVVYFADTLRRDPGGVAVRALGQAPELKKGTLAPMTRAAFDPGDADVAFQALVRDASTYGVRFYSVEGRGLAQPSTWVRSSQDTIASLALETGGVAFLNGLATKRIADGIVTDQSCWYLVSFDPSGWDPDRPLDLGVFVKQRGFRVQTRSSLVIPSPATLTATRLVAAHFGESTGEDRPLSLSIYPVGGTLKSLQVLAQVELPHGDIPPTLDTTWDVGFDVVSRGEIVAHNSNRMSWRGNGQPPVYQTMLSLPAGPYEIVAVAREAATDSIRTGRMNGTWPASSTDSVTLSLPALAQPQHGGIVLDGEVTASGIVVRGAGNPVDPRAPVAIVTAACIEGRKDTLFRAERRIVGETEVSFAPMELGPDEGRCVQIRDLVAAGSLGAGRLTYFVRILSGDAAIASQELAFDVADLPAPAPEVIAPPAR
jgi:hypothetical protein